MLVKLTLQLQILPDATQSKLLLETMRQYNAAASYAAKVGFEAQVFSQPSIHNRCYHEIRSRFGLSAQMTVRAMAKAVECFSRDKTSCPEFRPQGAITYDERILGFKGVDAVSLWTLQGRVRFPVVYGEYHKARLGRMKGQVDLVYREGKFFLYATVDIPENPPIQISEYLGVDLGIVNLATDSDGKNYSGDHVEKVRRRHQRNRRKFQKVGTKGAKKRLCKLAGREARFRKHENHCIAKSIVRLAKDTARGIALEELTHIRKRTTVRHKQRARHSSWSFAQLRAFVEYKAKLAGIPVILVDPRNSSRTCSKCGHCEKANRKNQAEFCCVQCRYSTFADFNAARNLAVWANRKLASELVGRHAA